MKTATRPGGKGIDTVFEDHCPVPSADPSGSTVTDTMPGMVGRDKGPNSPKQTIIQKVQGV
jgi:hypothetical protein